MTEPGAAPRGAQLAAALFERGNALYGAGRREEAVVTYGDALRAWPAHAGAHNNLGAVLEELGHAELALGSYRQAVLLTDDPTAGANFARAVRHARVTPDDAELRGLVARSLVAPWARPADLARVAGDLLCGLDEGRRVQEPLFAALLTSTAVVHEDLERQVTTLRRTLLEGGGDDLALACVVAQQCFIGEYVADESEAEQAAVERLLRDVAQALERREDVSPARIAVLAAYRPLHKLPHASRLLERAWPEPLRPVLALQVDEPRHVAALREALPALTAVEDDVSLRVRGQYEENPYPRWIDLPAAAPMPFGAWLARQLPRAPVDVQGSRALDVLVAGCGTGQEAIEVAQRHPDARVTAIDLSRASLAYAARQSQVHGIANVRYAQADLLALGSSGNRYDVVFANGVLHHLADPLAGWRALAGCLGPGGFMHVGLYSAHARRDVDAARAFVAARGDPPTLAGIRAARRALRADPRFDGVVTARDFHTTSECRDLLFHVEEHAFTLPRIEAALRELRLAFLGFSVPPGVLQRYREDNPRDEAATDLARWDAFERAHPATFLGMYSFWVRKTG